MYSLRYKELVYKDEGVVNEGIVRIWQRNKEKVKVGKKMAAATDSEHGRECDNDGTIFIGA